MIKIKEGPESTLLLSPLFYLCHTHQHVSTQVFFKFPRDPPLCWRLNCPYSLEEHLHCTTVWDVKQCSPISLFKNSSLKRDWALKTNAKDSQECDKTKTTSQDIQLNTPNSIFNTPTLRFTSIFIPCVFKHFFFLPFSLLPSFLVLVALWRHVLINISQKRNSKVIFSSENRMLKGEKSPKICCG